MTPVARIVFEPTWPYHRALETALSGKCPLVKVNPLQARRFAEACGTRTKTDAVDARILARMGAALNLEPDAPTSEIQLALRDLQVARSALVKERTRLHNRSHVQLSRKALLWWQSNILDWKPAIRRPQIACLNKTAICGLLFPVDYEISAAVAVGLLPSLSAV